MALARLERNMLSNQMEDLDKSISHCTEAILPPPHLWLDHGPMILRTLFLLASALFQRSMASKLPENAIYASKYLRYLRTQPHSLFARRRHAVTKMLVASLALQVELKAGDVLGIIEEMAARIPYLGCARYLRYWFRHHLYRSRFIPNQWAVPVLGSSIESSYRMSAIGKDA